MQEMSQAGYHPNCTAQNSVMQVELPHCQRAHRCTFASLAITSYTVFTDNHRQQKHLKDSIFLPQSFSHYLPYPRDNIHHPQQESSTFGTKTHACLFQPTLQLQKEYLQRQPAEPQNQSNQTMAQFSLTAIQSLLYLFESHSQSQLAMRHFLSLPKDFFLLLEENIQVNLWYF